MILAQQNIIEEGRGRVIHTDSNLLVTGIIISFSEIKANPM